MTRHSRLADEASQTELLTESLALGEQLLETIHLGFSELKSLCAMDGRLDEGRLGEHQQESYELALGLAEVQAGLTMARYALVRDREPLAMGVALALLAEMYETALGRLHRIVISLPLQDRPQTIAVSASYQKIIALARHPQFLAELGARIIGDAVTELSTGLNEEAVLLRSSARRFADEVVAPLAEDIHRQDTDIPEELISQAAALGCFGSCIPERFGGSQPDSVPDSLGMIVLTEELSRASLGAAGSLITRPEIAARALLTGGSVAQQETWLPRLASGETLCAIAITEPDAGSDVAAIKLRARPCEGGWLLNGRKTWSTFAGRSQLLLVLARTDTDITSGYKGLSLFLVEKPKYPGHTFEHRQDSGGLLNGRAIPTLGYRGMHSFELLFEDYFVPVENLLGEEAGLGQGFYYTMAGFAGGRIQTAARATGIMQAAFEKALAYASDRRAFGKPIADFQLIRIKLARMFGTLSASRQFSYAVARLMDSGAGQMQASLVKLFTCRAAEWLTREAMQIHGGMGYAEETAVSRYFVDARVLSIFEGTEEVLAIRVIARELINRAR